MPCLLPLVAGRGLTSLSNFYSSLYGAVSVSPSLLPEFLSLACRHIQEDEHRWPYINLHPLENAGKFAQIAIKHFSAAGYWTDSYFCFVNWYLEVRDRSFQQYFDGLPSRLRHTIERGRAKLSREGPWTVRILANHDNDLEAGIRDFAAIYGASWKHTEPFPDFIENLCRMSATHGWLRLGILSVGEQAIAAQIWIIKDGTASIYKLAYDQRFSRFSPGSILSAHMMEQAIDREHVRTVDYLTGDDAYKKDWMSHRRERVGLVAFNPATLQGWAAGSLHFAKKWLKRLLWR
jgi:hypothetical protein